MLNIQRFVFNMVEENTYVLWDDTLEAVIVDCGAFRDEERKALADFIADKGLTVRHLLQTHGHFDHIFGADFVCRTYGTGPEMAAAEQENYELAAERMRMFMHRALPLELPPVARYFRAGDTVGFGHHTLEVLATPGHTPGGICFYCKDEGVLLSGDSLFRYSIGRCDLPGGDERLLIDTIRENVMTLPDDVTVLPGHGGTTTVGEERNGNPYLR